MNALDLSISWNSHSVAFLETKLQLNLIDTIDPEHVNGRYKVVTAHCDEIGEALYIVTVQDIACSNLTSQYKKTHSQEAV